MNYVYSVVLLLPINLQEQGNRLACALGYDQLPGNTFSRPLSATGDEPATHVGCHTWTNQAFINMLGAASSGGGLPPADWSSFGLDETTAAETIAALTPRVQLGGDPLANWMAALQAASLQEIVPNLGLLLP